MLRYIPGEAVNIVCYSITGQSAINRRINYAIQLGIRNEITKRATAYQHLYLPSTGISRLFSILSRLKLIMRTISEQITTL